MGDDKPMPKAMMFYPGNELNVFLREYAEAHDLKLSQVIREALRKLKEEKEKHSDNA